MNKHGERVVEGNGQRAVDVREVAAVPRVDMDLPDFPRRADEEQELALCHVRGRHRPCGVQIDGDVGAAPERNLSKKHTGNRTTGVDDR